MSACSCSKASKMRSWGPWSKVSAAAARSPSGHSCRCSTWGSSGGKNHPRCGRNCGAASSCRAMGCRAAWEAVAALPAPHAVEVAAWLARRSCRAASSCSWAACRGHYGIHVVVLLPDAALACIRTGASLSAYDTPCDTHTASLHSWTACSRLLQGRCHLSTSGCLDALLCTWAA